MLIDGEKWACEACIRGHRVSNCHHSDRPLTHVNKKGRPVSQCPHCRGLRKSRTTHVRCECGDKKKSSSSSSNKNDPDSLAVDKGDLKQNLRQRCDCIHGQRCNCALKKDPPLDLVAETDLSTALFMSLSESKLSQLTHKSDGALTVFRDGHHKPVHRHNDMAHKCGLPYTIPRSHNIHSASDVHPSGEHRLAAVPTWDHLSEWAMEYSVNETRHCIKSEQGSPGNVSTMPVESVETPVPPLDLSSLFHCTPSGRPSLNESSEKTMTEAIVSSTFSGNSLEPTASGMPPADASYSSLTAADGLPRTQMEFQDSYFEPYFTPSDTDLQLGSAGFSAPSVDWSSFPLYSSSVSAPTSTQALSYASFDYSSIHPSMPPPSSSGDLSEVDELGPALGMGNSSSDLQSLSEGPELDQYRISSASSFASMPQAQLLAAEDLDSIGIDNFLKSTGQPTVAMEHQLHLNLDIEPKLDLDQSQFSMPEVEPDYKRLVASATSFSLAISPTGATWPSSTLFETDSTVDGDFFSPSWSR